VGVPVGVEVLCYEWGRGIFHRLVRDGISYRTAYPSSMLGVRTATAAPSSFIMGDETNSSHGRVLVNHPSLGAIVTDESSTGTSTSSSNSAKSEPVAFPFPPLVRRWTFSNDISTERPVSLPTRLPPQPVELVKHS
jgi:hypothetical protein